MAENLVVVERSELEALAMHNHSPSVSLLMPTHPLDPTGQQDQIRFKNLLQRAREMLEASAMEFLEPAESLLQESLFWQQQTEGLAVFSSKGLFVHYRLPIPLPEIAVVGERFHLKPLLPIIKEDQFYILALSQNEVRLLQCTPYRVKELDQDALPFPRNLAEALQYDDPERQLQFHTGTSGTVGRRPAMFHGHGVGKDDSKTNLIRYFRKVDSGLREVLAGGGTPVILACVEYLLPLYREASGYPHLVEKAIEGNPEGLNPQELHTRALAILEPIRRRPEEEAAARYHELLGTGKASSSLTVVVPAAYHGRVDTLFVAAGIQKWGRFDARADAVETFEAQASGTDDLLNVAALETFLKGGTVHVVEPEKVPGQESAAALFRF